MNIRENGFALFTSETVFVIHAGLSANFDIDPFGDVDRLLANEAERVRRGL